MICFLSRNKGQIQKKMISVSAANPVYRILWESEFHSMIENAVGNFSESETQIISESIFTRREYDLSIY